MIWIKLWTHLKGEKEKITSFSKLHVYFSVCVAGGRLYVCV